MAFNALTTNDSMCNWSSLHRLSSMLSTLTHCIVTVLNAGMPTNATLHRWLAVRYKWFKVIMSFSASVWNNLIDGLRICNASHEKSPIRHSSWSFGIVVSSSVTLSCEMHPRRRQAICGFDLSTSLKLFISMSSQLTSSRKTSCSLLILKVRRQLAPFTHARRRFPAFSCTCSSDSIPLSMVTWRSLSACTLIKEVLQMLNTHKV